jgi:hypothetical protein
MSLEYVVPSFEVVVTKLNGTLTCRHGEITIETTEKDFRSLGKKRLVPSTDGTLACLSISAVGLELYITRNDGHLQIKFDGADGGGALWQFDGLKSASGATMMSSASCQTGLELLEALLPKAAPLERPPVNYGEASPAQLRNPPISSNLQKAAKAALIRRISDLSKRENAKVLSNSGAEKRKSSTDITEESAKRAKAPRENAKPTPGGRQTEDLRTARDLVLERQTNKPKPSRGPDICISISSKSGDDSEEDVPPVNPNAHRQTRKGRPRGA